MCIFEEIINGLKEQRKHPPRHLGRPLIDADTKTSSQYAEKYQKKNGIKETLTLETYLQLRGHAPNAVTSPDAVFEN